MSLLLDTHVLLWWLEGADLEPHAAALIADPAVLVAVSAASIWEASIKQALSKLTVPGSLAEAALANGFEPLAITFAHAERAGALPPHHRDPFDRMLVAQAELEDLTLVTRDPAFDPYGVALVRG
jgi:PIN domain nuclease of toxin-antitoxin system